MGFFDKLKNKAQKTVNQVQGQVMPPQAAAPQAAAPQAAAPQAAAPQAAPPQAAPPQAAPPQAAAGSGATFSYDGETFPVPPGFEGLACDDWYYKLEQVKDNVMNVHQESVPEMHDEDGDLMDPEVALLVSKYGFVSAGQFEHFKNWGMVHFAQQAGEAGSSEQIGSHSFRMMGIAREKIMADKANAMSGDGGPLSPFEGVSCEAWAQMQAQIASGGDVAGIIAAGGLDQAKWDRVSAEWMARMSTDTTATVATVYGNAFSGASTGQFGQQAAQAVSQGVGGDVGEEPVSFERFCEISEAQKAAGLRGEDPNALLASFGLSALDWSNIGAYWSKKIQQDAMKYHELMTKYEAKYQAQYGGGDGLTSDEREVVVVNKILEMAGNGEAAQLLGYLQQKFPEDAQDFDALDWWMDKACDTCAEQGDRNRAQQILWARYPLQDDKSEPVEAYIESEMNSLF